MLSKVVLSFEIDEFFFGIFKDIFNKGFLFYGYGNEFEYNIFDKENEFKGKFMVGILEGFVQINVFSFFYVDI